MAYAFKDGNQAFIYKDNNLENKFSTSKAGTPVSISNYDSLVEIERGYCVNDIRFVDYPFVDFNKAKQVFDVQMKKIDFVADYIIDLDEIFNWFKNNSLVYEGNGYTLEPKRPAEFQFNLEAKTLRLYIKLKVLLT